MENNTNTNAIRYKIQIRNQNTDKIPIQYNAINTNTKQYNTTTNTKYKCNTTKS